MSSWLEVLNTSCSVAGFVQEEQLTCQVAKYAIQETLLAAVRNGDYQVS